VRARGYEAHVDRNGGKGGAIVNVSSLGALTGSPNAFIDYAASKGALDSMTIGLAAEVVGCGIRVNAVRPGLIDTDIHDEVGIPDRVKRFGPTMPIGRAGTPRRSRRGNRVAALGQGILRHRRLHQRHGRRALATTFPRNSVILRADQPVSHPCQPRARASASSIRTRTKP
jgi:NAD(P)-dependent dehydrogenase (short-subunit alcohol dehydrogenase family)